MKISDFKFHVNVIIGSIVCAVLLLELALFTFAELGHTEEIHHYIEIMSLALVMLVTCLSAIALFAYRSAKNRAERLTQERDRSKLLNARLNSQRAAVDAHTLVTISDAEGKILSANANMCRVSGYSEDELIGSDHRILNSGYHEPEFFKALYESLTEGEVWNGEICNRAKDGSLYWVSASISPIYTSNGHLKEVISIQTDITELKETAEKLESSHKMLRSIFDNFPGAISAYDGDLVLTLANPAFYSMLKCPEKQFPEGTTFLAMLRYNAERGEYGEGDVEELISTRLELAKKFEPHHFERETQDGRMLEVKGWPIEGGGFVSSHMDVTERHQLIEDLKSKNDEAKKAAANLEAAQQALSRTHEQLLTSVNSMQHGFIIWDGNDELVLANQSYLDMCGPAADMIVPGISFAEMLRICFKHGLYQLEDDKAEEYISKVADIRAQKSRLEREITLIDGRTIVITDTRMGNGEILSTYVDVTTHRQREAELRHTRDALAHIAYYDALTTLPNRARGQQDLEAMFCKLRNKGTFAIIHFDLDKFKRVNDTLGHAAGDQLLKTVGSRLAFFADKVPEFTVYRWGGDEFVGIVEKKSPEEIEELCQELTDLIAVPVEIDATSIWPTVSVGIAVYPDDATDLESLMICSDLALYKTKEMGRDGYHFFSSDMKEKVDHDIRIESGMRSALKLDQFELFFQPQIDLSNEKLVGVEALVRWNHPGQGLVPPGVFMDVVEKHGMAAALGRLVFDKGMSAIQSWVDEGLEFGRLALNLSPTHLKRKTLIDDFFESVDKYQINTDHLAVELLESQIVDEEAGDLSNLLDVLTNRGVHIELDDFGTGFASLKHLSSLPVDGIKIDRSFFSDISNDPKQQAVLEVVMSMSKLMKLRVVCEGIERADQLSAIPAINNCSVQGYLIAQPMSFGDMTQWIREGRNVGALANSDASPSPRAQSS